MTHNDFSNYRKMSEPLASPQVANQALQAFFEAVEKARKEHHIMDVHIIVKINIMNGESEGAAMSSAHFGNTLEGAPMCAWGLGQEQASFENSLREYVKSVGKP